jgi:hypothetical protein
MLSSKLTVNTILVLKLVLNKIIRRNCLSCLLLIRNKILNFKSLIIARLLRQLRPVRPLISLTLNTLMHMGTVSKAVPGWAVILRYMGYGTILLRNILPLEGRRRLTDRNAQTAYRALGGKGLPPRECTGRGWHLVCPHICPVCP